MSRSILCLWSVHIWDKLCVRYFRYSRFYQSMYDIIILLIASGYYAANFMLYVCPDYSSSISGASTCTCSTNSISSGVGVSLVCSPVPSSQPSSLPTALPTVLTCNPGRYRQSHTCPACPTGKYTSTVDATACAYVPAGSFSSTGASYSSCAYSLIAGASTCQPNLYPLSTGFNSFFSFSFCTTIILSCVV